MEVKASAMFGEMPRGRIGQLALNPSSTRRVHGPIFAMGGAHREFRGQGCCATDERMFVAAPLVAKGWFAWEGVWQ